MRDESCIAEERVAVLQYKRIVLWLAEGFSYCNTLYCIAGGSVLQENCVAIQFDGS